MVTLETCANVGGVVSTTAEYTTVTVKFLVVVFPAASDAVQTTVVVPVGKNVGEDGEQVGPEVTPTLSVAEGVAYDTSLPFGSVV